MKLAWFSPFHNGCGPGFMSLAVVKSLVDYFDIEVFNHWSDREPAFEVPGVTVTEINDSLDLRKVARDFDIIIYNLGNNEENHLHILNALKRQPGIVVMHDFVMQHALVADMFVRKQEPDIYYWLMARLYGLAGVCAAQEAYSMQRNPNERIGLWDSAATQRFPMFETIAHLATGCIVHSEFFEEKLRASFPGPVLRSQIPYNLKKIVPAEVIESFYSVRPRVNSPVTFVYFGHISLSKCVDRMIRAFGASDFLRNNAKLLICGGMPPTYGHYLQQLCTLNRLGEVVEFRGRINDRELYAMQVEADVFINLRHPNTEGQSASLIEQMAAGKPVVCFDSGCFGDLPDDVAYKVSDPHNLDELVMTLERIAGNLDERQAVGQRGREYALQHDCDRYARDVFEFVFENRAYFRALQLGTVPPATAMHPSQEEGLQAHLELMAHARETWSVLDQKINPLSRAAFEMLDDDTQGHFRAFLEVRDQSLSESMQAILDAPVTAPNKSHTDPSRFLGTVMVEPLLEIDFWEGLDSSPADEFVQICYKKILCRIPNPAEIQGYIRAIEVDGLKQKEMIRIVLLSDEAKHRFGLDGLEYDNFLNWCSE